MWFITVTGSWSICNFTYRMLFILLIEKNLTPLLFLACISIFRWSWNIQGLQSEGVFSPFGITHMQQIKQQMTVKFKKIYGNKRIYSFKFTVIN